MMKNSSLLLIAFLLLFSSEVVNAHAIECSEGGAFVESLSSDVIKITANDKLSFSQKEIDLTNIFKSRVDTDWMGKFALGRNWRSIKEDQQKEYLSAYQSYLINTYVPKFKAYKNQQVIIVGTTPLKRDGESLVETKVSSAGEPDISLTYRVRKDDACFVIRDIVAEGVSLINTQRQDFSSTYRNKGFDKLVALLKSK